MFKCATVVVSRLDVNCLLVNRINVLFKSGEFKKKTHECHGTAACSFGITKPPFGSITTAANNIQMNAALRCLLSNLSMHGLIERLRGAGTLNSLADICRGWFQSAD